MLMVRKFKNIHATHNGHHGAVNTFKSLFKDEKGRWHFPSWVYPLSDYGSLLFKVLFLFGTIGLLMSLRRPIDYWAPGVFSALMVLESSS